MESLLQVSEITLQYRPAIGRKPTVKSALNTYILLRELYSPETICLQENFIVLYLNRTNRVLSAYKASTGGITGTVADLRLIFAAALKIAATGIILSHNHPSESLKPSTQDIDLTAKFKAAGDILDVKVIDHLIITSCAYYSFADEGLL